MDLLELIEVRAGVRSAKPCIVGTRITVYDILEYLAGGMSDEEILDYALVSKDGDFRQLAFLHGAPRKVVSLQIGNSPTSAAVAILKASKRQALRSRSSW